MSLSTLNKYMDDARRLASDLGVTTRDLTDKELVRFERAFQRQFVRNYPERQVVDVYTRHRPECLLGAMIAKEQMDAEIDSEQPASNKIGGPLPIRACWLGIGDDWEDIRSIYNAAQNAWTTGSCQNWIHSGTLLMGGTAGNAIRIGENAVHVIFGIDDSHPAPRVEVAQFTIDGKEKPILQLQFAQRVLPGAARPIRELDNVYVFKKDTTLKAEVMIPEAFGAVSAYQTSFPRLIGVSYIKEPALRLQDPVTGAGRVLPGTRYEVVHTT
jgi:hypothetical protein